MKIEELRQQIIGEYPEEGLAEAFGELLNIADGQQVGIDDIEKASEADPHDCADNMVQPYTYDLLQWHAEDVRRVSYMEDAIKELGAETGCRVLTGSQYLYWAEKLQDVQKRLQTHLECVPA